MYFATSKYTKPSLTPFFLILSQRDSEIRCSHFGVTIVCTKTEDKEKKVIGFYTLCPTSVERDHLPKKLFTGPRPNPIPAFRICRLAVDKQFQGNGYGKYLLIHALKKCITQAAQIGGSIVIIDAKHEKAKNFYEHFGFIEITQNSLVLAQRISYFEHHFQLSLNKS